MRMIFNSNWNHCGQVKKYKIIIIVKKPWLNVFRMLLYEPSYINLLGDKNDC